MGEAHREILWREEIHCEEREDRGVPTCAFKKVGLGEANLNLGGRRDRKNSHGM